VDKGIKNLRVLCGCFAELAAAEEDYAKAVLKQV
jgi:hypothetical protein